jgi:hypothetical protein
MSINLKAKLEASISETAPTFVSLDKLLDSLEFYVEKTIILRLCQHYFTHR